MFLSRIPVLSRCLLKGCSSWNPKAPMGQPRCVAIAKSWLFLLQKYIKNMRI